MNAMPDNEVRWLLLDEYTSTEKVPVAVCADIDGLFVDRPAPPRERFTLIGCVPAGRLRAAVDAVGTDEAWLGNVVLQSVHDRDHDSYRRLLDVTVVSARMSTAGPEVVDVQLDGLIQAGVLATVIDVRPGVRRQDWTDITLTDSAFANLGRCREVDGVYHDRPQPPSPPVTLIGWPDRAATGAEHQRVAVRG